MHHFLVISHQKTPELEAKRASFTEALTQHGHELSTLSLGKKKTEIADWITKQTRENTVGIFLVECPQETIQTILSTFKGLVWVCNQAAPAWSATFPQATQITDWLLASQPLEEWLFRFHIRIAQHEAQITRTQEFETKTRAVTKNEVIIHQREEFLGVCAHDLRSPLGLIQAGIQMVLRGNGKESTLSTLHHELLTRALRQSGYALQLVNDLLDVTSYEQGLKPEFEVIDLDAFLKEFHRDYTFHAEQKKITLSYKNKIPGWRVLIDKDRVSQVFQNLLTNAIKFTPEGKNIYIEVSSFTGRRKADPEHPMLIVTFRDEGCGIAETEKQKIFDRFSQIKTTQREQGRGLGLSVAKQISQSHDGNLWVESTEGKGSSFHVLFPHVISSPTATSEHRTRPLAIVAEQDETKRAKNFECLKEWGFDCLYSRDGVETLTLTHFYRPDCVILTPGQGKMEEFEVASTLKISHETSDIPIFYVSESGLMAKGEQSLAADEIFKLPLNQKNFQSVLKRSAKKAA